MRRPVSADQPASLLGELADIRLRGEGEPAPVAARPDRSRSAIVRRIADRGSTAAPGPGPASDRRRSPQPRQRPPRRSGPRARILPWTAGRPRAPVPGASPTATPRSPRSGPAGRRRSGRRAPAPRTASLGTRRLAAGRPAAIDRLGRLEDSRSGPLADDVARGDEPVDRRPSAGRPDLGRRLLHLDLGDEVALADGRARLDEPRHEDALLDGLRQARHLDLAAHVPRSPARWLPRGAGRRSRPAPLRRPSAHQPADGGRDLRRGRAGRTARAAGCTGSGRPGTRGAPAARRGGRTPPRPPS